MYFDKTDILRYKLLRGKPALIPAASVIYIIAGVNLRKGSLEMSEDTHLDVISTIDGLQFLIEKWNEFD